MPFLKKLLCFPFDALAAAFFWVFFCLFGVFFTSLSLAALIFFSPFLFWVWDEYTEEKCEDLLRKAEIAKLKQYQLSELSLKTLTFERHKNVLMRYIEVEHDNPDAKTILLLHGESMTSISMLPLVHILKSKYRVIALDLPGFGRSVVPTKSLLNDNPLRGLVFYIQEFCEAKKLDSFVLVGHSFGAYIALNFTDYSKERVSQLVLMDPIGIFPGIGSLGAFWPVFFNFGLIDYPSLFGRCGRILAHNFLTDAINTWFPISFPTNLGTKIVASMIQLSFLGSYWSDPKSHILSILTTYTTLVYGRYDMVVGIHQGQAINDMFDMELLIVDDVGHIPFETPKGAEEVANFIHETAKTTMTRNVSRASVKLRPHSYKTNFNPMSLPLNAKEAYANASNKDKSVPEELL